MFRMFWTGYLAMGFVFTYIIVMINNFNPLESIDYSGGSLSDYEPLVVEKHFNNHE